MPKIINTQTGLSWTVDKHASRLSRMRRRVLAWATMMQEWRATRSGETRLRMVTLTYKSIYAWRPNHIREFMYRSREYFGERLAAYAWVAELQWRGAVHYHVLLAHTGRRGMPAPDTAGWWVHGSSRVEVARSPFYVMKYTSKGHHNEHDYPRGARMFAVWGAPTLALETSGYAALRLSVAPKWLFEQIPEGISWWDVKRWPSGGWRVRDVIFSSPYKFVST